MLSTHLDLPLGRAVVDAQCVVVAALPPILDSDTLVLVASYPRYKMRGDDVHVMIGDEANEWRKSDGKPDLFRTFNLASFMTGPVVAAWGHGGISHVRKVVGMGVYVSGYVCMYACMHVFMRVCIYAYACTYVCMHVLCACI